MSLLLDARKKSQQANSAQSGDTSRSALDLSLEPLPDAVSQSSASSPEPDKARATGQNLFNAKSRAPSFALAGNNRNLLIALVGTVILLATGAVYVWYAIAPNNNLRPAAMSAAIASQPMTGSIQPQNNSGPSVSAEVAPLKSVATPKPAHTAKVFANARRAHKNNPMVIEQRQDEPIDPILNNAYLAYSNGALDQAQQLYRQALNLDSSNTDALLGLAAIAQRRGEDNLSAHYYAQVMALDPRNAVANAGLSALTNDDNRESRLKTLLNEQPNSSSLYFALGNYYTEQARWSEAQQAYFNAYKVEPDNVELAFNLAVSLDRLGQSKSAAQYYQRALQLDPGNHAGFDHATISQHIKELTH